MSKIIFVVSSNPIALAAALAGKASATVEAEYGEVCVPGTVLTMAHHGERAGQPAPCSYENGCLAGEVVEVVGLSHFDLDTLGGCAAIIGRKPSADGFWRLAEFIDLNGAHKLARGINETDASPEDVRVLHAFWAWSKSFRVFAPRDGSVADVTKQVLEGIHVLESILVDQDEVLLAAGDAFRAAEGELNRKSFLEADDGVVVRVGDQFTNHLYADPDGEAYKAVVSYNTATGAVTVSFAETPQGMSANSIVQKVFTDRDDEGKLLAGGHAGIAGSPRNRRASLDEFARAVQVTRETIAGR